MGRGQGTGPACGGGLTYPGNALMGLYPPRLIGGVFHILERHRISRPCEVGRLRICQSQSCRGVDGDTFIAEFVFQPAGNLAPVDADQRIWGNSDKTRSQHLNDSSNWRAIGKALIHSSRTFPDRKMRVGPKALKAMLRWCERNFLATRKGQGDQNHYGNCPHSDGQIILQKNQPPEFTPGRFIIQ